LLYIASYLRPGYIVIMPLLLLLYWLLPKQRPMVRDFIGLSNLLLLICITINLYGWASDIFKAWYGQNAYEQWSFSNGPIGLSYLIVNMVLECLIAILLLFKKWRPTIWLSIVAWLCSSSFTTAFIADQLNQFFFRDYLPSSWSFTYSSMAYHWLHKLLPPFLFAATALCIHWLRQRYRTYKQEKKLAYPPQTEKH
jgi:hypothetical protein